MSRGKLVVTVLKISKQANKQMKCQPICLKYAIILGDTGDYSEGQFPWQLTSNLFGCVQKTPCRQYRCIQISSGMNLKDGFHALCSDSDIVYKIVLFRLIRTVWGHFDEWHSYLSAKLPTMAAQLRNTDLICCLLWHSLMYCCALVWTLKEAHLHPDTKKNEHPWVNGIFSRPCYHQ